MTTMTELIRQLAVREPDGPVLSVHLRTDPRDPANTARTPGWLVALRNGQREVSRAVEEHGSREERLALRGLLEQVEGGVLAKDAGERGRGLVWFVTADRELDHRLTLQLPLRDHVVRWDARPFVSPLVDVADRGRPAGLVLISTEAMRLLHWEAGRIEEPERSLYEFDRGEWRDYATYAMADPGWASMHVDTVEDRLEEWRRRFLREAASTLVTRLGELDWERLLMAGDARAVGGLAAALPNPVRERIVTEVNANLLWEEPGALAERLGEDLEAAWAREARALAESAIEAAQSRGLGAMGWPEVLDSLIQHRIRHLVFALGAAPAPGRVPLHAFEALGSPSLDLFTERVVELAVEAGAGVTALGEQESDVLARAGGVAATLRY
jgi:hypothetical protein